MVLPLPAPAADPAGLFALAVGVTAVVGVAAVAPAAPARAPLAAEGVLDAVAACDDVEVVLPSGAAVGEAVGAAVSGWLGRPA